MTTQAAAPDSSTPSTPATDPKNRQRIFPPLTKIVATLGPASSDPEMIGKLIETGVSIFRINFSHGEMDQHAANVRTIRDTALRMGIPTGILGDLQGPKIRIGKVPGGGIDVPTGSLLRIQREEIEAHPPEEPNGSYLFSSTYPKIVDDVEPGQRVLINDGAVRTLVVRVEKDSVLCTVTHGGLITSGKGINLPDSDLTVDSISERDWEHVRWAVEHEIDLLALSFVKSADDVKQLREGVKRISRELGKESLQIPIVAKIELPRAVERIESIVDAADAIMVARGDLGVELDLARVPVVQKQLMRVSDHFGKPCIVATQMLETMMNSPSPTRAEANDVANAIMDYTDAVMLSGETAVGKYPVVTVETMRRIAEHTEPYLAAQPAETSAPGRLIETRYRTAALAHGVWTVAQDIAAKFIIVWSQEGGGARYLSQNNFHIPIIAVTTERRAARRMQLYRGVFPVRMPLPDGVAHFTRLVDEYLLRIGWAEKDDMCVLVAGEPIGTPGVTNSLAIHSIGNPDTGYARHETRES